MSNQPFINVPKEIFNLKISIEAKYIYELMLDRHKLSIINDWSDNNNQYYIHYTIKELQKATGIGNKKVCKLLQELEENNLIIKKRQGQGKPSKIFVQDIENLQKSSKKHTEFDEKNNKKDISKSDEKNNKCKKDISKVEKTFKKEISKEHTNNKIEEKNPEVTEIIETFERFIGRKPDKSFRKTIAKRLKTGLDIKIIKAAIEKAYKTQAKKPEAFILYLTQHNQNLTQYKQTENTVEQERTQQQTDKPLEEWEVEWLLEVAKYQQDKEKIDECNKMLDEFSKQRLEKQITDMLANS